MIYRFIGKLCGYVCKECPEALANVRVRLYRHRKGQDVTSLAVAAPKDTLAILTDKEVQAKSSSLIAETTTDGDGNFAFELSDDDYDGEAFELDVYLTEVPGKNGKSDPLQFTVTTIQPRYKQTDSGLVAVFEYCVPYRFWCGVRARFDAWAICGRVITCETQSTLAGLKVTAFDTDWTQDDELGSAVTDSDGKFRIDYTSADFKKTPFSPFINLELYGGPDLYFKVEGAGGVVLLDEPRSRGRDADREDVGQCFCVELCVPIEEPPPFEHPWFTHVGDFHVLSDIDATTGKTASAVLGHGGPGFGFHGGTQAQGFLPEDGARRGALPCATGSCSSTRRNPGIEVAHHRRRRGGRCRRRLSAHSVGISMEAVRHGRPSPIHRRGEGPDAGGHTGSDRASGHAVGASAGASHRARRERLGRGGPKPRSMAASLDRSCDSAPRTRCRVARHRETVPATR